MSTNYTQSIKTLNQKGSKAPKSLFMSPVFVKRHDSDLRQGRNKINPDNCTLTPTKEKLTNHLPTINNLIHCIPRESSTQTSKTILQLAQIDQKHQEVNNKAQICRPKSKPMNVFPHLPSPELIGENPDLSARGDEDAFSEDSLNKRQQPEKENPIHRSIITRDLQDYIELKDAKDARLHEWVDNIKSSTLSHDDLRSSECNISDTPPPLPGNVNSTVGIVSLHGIAKYSLETIKDVKSTNGLAVSSGTDLSTHKLHQQKTLRFCCCQTQLNEDVEDVQHVPKTTPNRNITSFHNLINLTPKKSIVPSKLIKLEMWHTQFQYGLESNTTSSEHCIPSPRMDSDNENLSEDYLDHTQISQQTTFVSNLSSTSKKLSCRQHTMQPKAKNIRSRSLVERQSLNNSSSANMKSCMKRHRAPVYNMEDVEDFNKFGSASMVESASLQKYIYPTGRKTESNIISTFMSPTLSSEKKSLKQQVESVRWLMGNKFKGGPASPRMKHGKHEIPFTKNCGRLKARAVKSEDFGKMHVIDGENLRDEKIPAAFSSSTLFGSSSSCDNGLFLLLNRIKSPEFNAALKGLAEIIDCARNTSRSILVPYMTLINQRLLELLKSPRSHVARTACQLTGHFFEVMKDTRRPEFDDIVNTLLYKTADASKFIRQDANLALDAMVTHIPVFHAVRSICEKGPTHRNPLVRCATVRLTICAVVIAGPNAIMSNPNLESTRKRIIANLYYSLDDKNVDTRKYGERLYKILHKEGTFDYYAKKYLTRTKHDMLMSTIKMLNKKPNVE